jgi:mRNA interferase MazF
MQKKLTITIDEHVYKGLHTVVGRGIISQFIESLVRPHVIAVDLENGYKQMAEAVIISNDVSNKFINRVQVVPFTTNTQKLYPSEAYVTLEGKQVKALATRLTTVNKLRIKKKAGKLSKDDMQQIDRIVKVQLGLWDK